MSIASATSGRFTHAENVAQDQAREATASEIGPDAGSRSSEKTKYFARDEVNYVPSHPESTAHESYQ